METFRKITDEFQIDGISMPMPNDFSTNTQIISTDDSGRLAGNGAMHIEYLTHVFVTTWTYQFMTGYEYDLVYQAYIINTIKNKNMYHTIKTIDSNTGKALTYQLYTQNELQAKLRKLTKEPSWYLGVKFENGVRMYENVTFTFVGVGGEEYVDPQ